MHFLWKLKKEKKKKSGKKIIIMFEGALLNTLKEIVKTLMHMDYIVLHSEINLFVTKSMQLLGLKS